MGIVMTEERFNEINKTQEVSGEEAIKQSFIYFNSLSNNEKEEYCKLKKLRNLATKLQIDSNRMSKGIRTIKGSIGSYGYYQFFVFRYDKENDTWKQEQNEVDEDLIEIFKRKYIKFRCS